MLQNLDIEAVMAWGIWITVKALVKESVNNVPIFEHAASR